MKLIDNEKIKSLSTDLESGMIEFMKLGETAYSQSDVEACMKIVAHYLDELDKTASNDDAMKLVETTVMALNQLNEKCDHEMIETDQREDLAEIIIHAAHLKGFNEEEDDITEDWREW